MVSNYTYDSAVPAPHLPVVPEIPGKAEAADAYPVPSRFSSQAHSVQFYHDDVFLLDDLGRFFGAALEAGQACVVIATRAHRVGLARRLKARGVDLATAVKQGRYVALDAAATLSRITVEGRPVAEPFAKVVGGVLARATERARPGRPEVAAFGEMVALLWAEGKREAALELERLWNDLARTYSFNLRCAYPMSLFPLADDGARFGEICAAHTDVIPAESYTRLDGDRERLDAIALWQQKAQALETELRERERIEEELRRALEERDEFLSVAAHELKTPLTGLQGYAQLLLIYLDKERELGPERLRSSLVTLNAQARKLSRLVARLLDNSQIEAGKLRIEPVRADMVALVDQVIEQLQMHTRGGHKVLFNAPERLEAVVDPVRFEQVVANLLDNAVKFSPDGGVIRVDLEREGKGGFRLTVTDQGVGVPPGQHEAIFERYYRAHSQQYLSGMGLSLYICREIVELHKGSIRVEEPGHPGARFVVKIPPIPPAAQDREGV